MPTPLSRHTHPPQTVAATMRGAPTKGVITVTQATIVEFLFKVSPSLLRYLRHASSVIRATSALFLGNDAETCIASSSRAGIAGSSRAGSETMVLSFKQGYHSLFFSGFCDCSEGGIARDDMTTQP
ncbi:MAG: hypothetical protein OXF02_04265 [Simkaniaceae bacterium]|nr:hypothetical protein [Simkaniaceae bacterium]